MTKHKQDIIQIVEKLEEAKESIHSFINESRKKGLLDKAESAFDVLEEVLKKIGKGLYEAAKSYMGEKEKDLKFYFFPGYTTLGGDRVLIRSSLTPENSKDNPMFTGIGYVNGRPFFNCPSTLYYEAIIKDMSDPDYFGPTTHHWKRQQDYSIDIKLKDDNPLPLKVMLIECSGSRKKSKIEQGICHIVLPKVEIENSVNFISTQLSKTSGLLKITDKENKYIRWPLHKPNNWNHTSEQFKRLAEVQELVYPIWFAATFSDILQGKSNKESANKWLQSINEIITGKGYGKLADRIERFRNYETEYLRNNKREYKPVSFTHWYSLFFDTKEHKQELGSAMILSDRQLPREYLFYSSSWLQQIYGLIRMEDYALVVRRNERTENFSVFHHNAKFHLNYVKQSISINQLTNAGFATDFLHKIITLSKYALEPKRYLEINKNECEEINLKERIEIICDIIKTDIIHNKAKLTKIGSTELLKEITERINSNNLIEFELDEIKITSYPEIVDVIFKDIIANAIGNAVGDKHISIFKGLPLVKIHLKKAGDKEVQFSVSNHKTIPDQFAEAYKSGLFDLNEAVEVPWGVLITSNYCKRLGYDIIVKTSNKKPQTTISIKFKNDINHGEGK